MAVRCWLLFFFFFSSRRRHTRCSRDWSSDVCSSDLFCRDVQEIAPEKLRLEQIDVSLVEAFLDYLETERKSSPRTRNHRLATLHAFFRYVQAEEPAHMLQCQKILAIPLRRQASPTVA